MSQWQSIALVFSFIGVLLAQGDQLYVQVIVSQESDFDFSGYIPAIKLALRLINSDSMTLPDYTLGHTEIINSKCSATPGVHGFIDHVTKPKMNMTEIMIIGADCSVSSQPIASLAQFWNLVQVSIDSSSPRLSDTNLYPYFVRPVPPDDSISTAIVALMKHFDWKYLAIITQEEDLFTLAREALTEEVKKENLKTIFSEAFPSDQSPQNIVNNLKMSSSRVIFLNTYPEYALEVLCQAYSLGMTYPEYAWISFGWYFEDFWKESFTNRAYQLPKCSPADIESIVNHMFMVNTYPELDETDNPTFIGGINKSQYDELYRREWISYFNHSNFTKHPNEMEKTAFGYDATWLAALALHKAELNLSNSGISLHNFTREDANVTAIRKQIQDIVYASALNITFNGASGHFSLKGNGDRFPELGFSQYRNENGNLTRKKVARLEGAALNVFPDVEPLYPGSTNPKSHSIESIHVGLFVTYTILAVAGIAFAIVCLVFNVLCRAKQIVKLSSPNLNVVFIMGISMTYLLVIVMGLDRNLISGDIFYGLCQVPVWIGVIAFTLIYGVVLAKTFKVFFIIKNLQVSRPDKKRTIQDWHMFLLIGLLLVIDVVFLVVVTGIPNSILHPQLVDLPLQAGEVPSEAYLCQSPSSHIWGPILLVYKAVELVFSLVFAFETRKIKVKELNDSRMVIFSVYTIVVAGIAVAPVIALLNDRVTIRYAITGVICLATATVLLAMNFIPKMHSLRRHPSGEKEMNFTSLAGNQLSKAVPSSKLSSSSEPANARLSSSLPVIRENDSTYGNQVPEVEKEES